MHLLPERIADWREMAGLCPCLPSVHHSSPVLLGPFFLRHGVTYFLLTTPDFLCVISRESFGRNSKYQCHYSKDPDMYSGLNDWYRTNLLFIEPSMCLICRRTDAPFRLPSIQFKFYKQMLYLWCHGCSDIVTVSTCQVNCLPSNENELSAESILYF